MANKITIKVVGQKINLNYQGTATKSSLVAASRMSALLNASTVNGPSTQAASKEKTSVSYTLYESKITDPITKQDSAQSHKTGPLVFAFEPALAMFKTFESSDAANRRREFFSAVENGKKELVEKYGNRIPNSEILELAKKMKRYSCIIFKYQIITTRTDDKEFPGSRLTREGKYSASVKSKTIYTNGPLTDEQMILLHTLLVRENDPEDVTIATKNTYQVPVSGYKSAFTSKSGAVILKELSSS